MLKDKVLDTINRYNLIENGDKIIVGVSGGPDSISLLNVLNDIKNDNNIKLNFDIFAVHINHMIRKEAIDDENFVKEYCKSRNIKFYSKRVDVVAISKDEKIGTEEAGRQIRYKFFNEILKKEKANKIATAHTKTDNAETVLMNIIRGASISGIKGMKPLREGVYIKPLIECTREEIEEYCTQNSLNPRYDKTNKENIYTRNKIRNILIPLIERMFNPSIVDGLNRLARKCLHRR